MQILTLITIITAFVYPTVWVLGEEGLEAFDINVETGVTVMSDLVAKVRVAVGPSLLSRLTVRMHVHARATCLAHACVRAPDPEFRGSGCSSRWAVMHETACDGTCSERRPARHHVHVLLDCRPAAPA